jgi:acyl-CoA thioester hydrolase
VATTEFYVRYAETDAMGIVHHASYIVWMEESRSSYARARGTDYADFERTGYALSVIDVHARYRASARYGDLINVRCWVAMLSSRGVTFNYEIINARTALLLVTGETRHICLNKQGQPSIIPENARWWMS